MKSVTIREAKNWLTELAREVESGKTIVVTRNGTPVFDIPAPANKGSSFRGDQNSNASAEWIP